MKAATGKPLSCPSDDEAIIMSSFVIADFPTILLVSLPAPILGIKASGVEDSLGSDHYHFCIRCSLIARFMGPTLGPSGADRTQVGPMLAPRTLLSGLALSTSLYLLGKYMLQCFVCDLKKKHEEGCVVAAIIILKSLLQNCHLFAFSVMLSDNMMW